jgi:transposase
MRIIGCDLHARQQTIAMLDSDTGELEEKTLEHQGETVREFYSALPGPILVGIEATGSMQWFLELMEELGIECRVGHPAKIRKVDLSLTSCFSIADIDDCRRLRNPSIVSG